MRESSKKKEKLIVPDVHNFSGHIVCDDRSKSEIVVPVFDKEDRLVAVLDVDSDQLNAFDEIDAEYLEKMVNLLLDDFAWKLAGFSQLIVIG